MDKKLSSPLKSNDKKPFAKVNKDRVTKPKKSPWTAKAFHLAGHISHGEICFLVSLNPLCA